MARSFGWILELSLSLSLNTEYWAWAIGMPFVARSNVVVLIKPARKAKRKRVLAKGAHCCHDSRRFPCSSWTGEMLKWWHGGCHKVPLQVDNNWRQLCAFVLCSKVMKQQQEHLREPPKMTSRPLPSGGTTTPTSSGAAQRKKTKQKKTGKTLRKTSITSKSCEHSIEIYSHFLTLEGQV